MARIVIDDEFWVMVQSVAAMTGDYDKTVSQALRLIQLSQQRYKSGKIITKSEYEAYGFFKQFIGLLIVEIEPGSYQYVYAETEFKWLLDRQEAGRRGGLAKNDGKKQASAEREKRRRANNLVNLAVKAGTITRPLECEQCNMSANRIEGHHDDYEKPLEVRWLCRECHDIEHQREINRLRTSIAQAPTSNQKPITITTGSKEPYSALAQKVLIGIKKFGPGDSEPLKKYLGESLYLVASKAAGGFYEIRRMPTNDFTIKNLATLLRDSDARIQQTKEQE